MSSACLSVSRVSLALTVVMTCVPANALGDGKFLDVYDCVNEGEAIECKSCKKSKENLRIKFTARSPENAVFFQVNIGGKLLPPERFDGGCAVVDEKNWSCESRSGVFGTRHGMANGIYSSVIGFYSPEGFFKAVESSCAK